MTSPVVVPPARPSGSPPPSGGWDRLLMTSAAALASTDIIVCALKAEVIPSLAAGVVLTAIGLAVMRIRRVAGIVVIASTTTVLLVGSVPFMVDHLGHPESGIDWIHASLSVLGRCFVLGAAVAAWRERGDAGARLAAVLAVGVVSLVVTVALVATAVTDGDERGVDDVVVVVDSTAFPERIVVGSGEVLYVDNTHIFRHTFTVEGTDIDVELPALQGVRIPIDLPAGTYEVLCDVPGHDSMTAVLVVE